MRVFVWREYYAICDGCRQHAGRQGNTFGTIRSEAIKVAFKNGWRQINGKFLCPRCQVKEKAI